MASPFRSGKVLLRKGKAMQILKHWLVLLLPPIVTTALRGFLRRANQSAIETRSIAGLRATFSEWEMVPAEEWPTDGGWTHGSIAETQTAKWIEFKTSLQAPRPFGLAHEAPPDAPVSVSAHNITMSFGYVLGRLLAEMPTNRTPAILDWGGGLGHYAAIARSMFPHIDFDYTVKDVEALVSAGQRMLPDVAFTSSDEAALAKPYDLVFASSSIQYSRDVYECLEKLCASAQRWLMITRTPFVDESDDFVVIQRPHRYGYLTEYAGWFLNRQKFTDFVVGQGFCMEREFLLDERPFVPNAPEQCRYRGYLFERAKPRR